MQINKNRGAPIIFARTNKCCSILNRLKLFDCIFPDIIQQRITVVKLGGNEGMNENLGDRRGYKFSYTRDITKMIKGRFTNGVNARKHSQGTIKNDTNISSRLRLLIHV